MLGRKLVPMMMKLLAVLVGEAAACCGCDCDCDGGSRQCWLPLQEKYSGNKPNVGASGARNYEQGLGNWMEVAARALGAGEHDVSLHEAKLLNEVNMLCSVK